MVCVHRSDMGIRSRADIGVEEQKSWLQDHESRLMETRSEVHGCNGRSSSLQPMNTFCSIPCDPSLQYFETLCFRATAMAACQRTIHFPCAFLNIPIAPWNAAPIPPPDFVLPFAIFPFSSCQYPSSATRPYFAVF